MLETEKKHIKVRLCLIEKNMCFALCACGVIIGQGWIYQKGSKNVFEDTKMLMNEHYNMKRI